jgi:hypothetical protein
MNKALKAYKILWEKIIRVFFLSTIICKLILQYKVIHGEELANILYKKKI